MVAIEELKKSYSEQNIEISIVGESGYTDDEPINGRLNLSDILIFSIENCNHAKIHIYHWNKFEEKYYMIYSKN